MRWQGQSRPWEVQGLQGHGHGNERADHKDGREAACRSKLPPSRNSLRREIARLEGLGQKNRRSKMEVETDRHLHVHLQSDIERWEAAPPDLLLDAKALCDRLESIAPRSAHYDCQTNRRAGLTGRKTTGATDPSRPAPSAYPSARAQCPGDFTPTLRASSSSTRGPASRQHRRQIARRCRVRAPLVAYR